MNIEKLITAVADILSARYGVTVKGKPGRG